FQLLIHKTPPKSENCPSPAPRMPITATILITPKIPGAQTTIPALPIPRILLNWEWLRSKPIIVSEKWEPYWILDLAEGQMNSLIMTTEHWQLSNRLMFPLPLPIRSNSRWENGEPMSDTN